MMSPFESFSLAECMLYSRLYFDKVQCMYTERSRSTAVGFFRHVKDNSTVIY